MSIFQLSTRLRKIEDRLKEPMEITDPILNLGHSREYSRNTCIYGTLIKSIEACMVLIEQKNVLNDIISDVRHSKSALETIKNDQANQNKASEDMMTAIKENAENIESNYKLIFAMFFWVVIALAMLAVALRLWLRYMNMGLTHCQSYLCYKMAQECCNFAINPEIHSI